MKYSVNWLREFVDLPDQLEELAGLLTLAGVEIEKIESRGVNIDRVVVGQITGSARHPNADRLTVCEVEDGSGIKRQIVCGATNYKVGDKVPLALPGAVLPNGLKIRATKLRDVESEGMLCSQIELGAGEDAAGLMILSTGAKPGTPIRQLFPDDTILDVEITPNRGDLLSHFGLAREISAVTGKPLRSPFQAWLGSMPTPQYNWVELLARQECLFFSARRIDNVRVGSSPEWMAAKLESVGIRSINNIVDISNYVMVELGQPTHAFDADRLKGNIRVRLAQDRESFLALDGKTYSLSSSNLMIADQERAVGIGGVMGGEETAVSGATRNVLLEAAYFLPASVRRTARSLNLPSDASYRFERGVDPGMLMAASRRAADLMREFAGGQPAAEIFVAGQLPAAHTPVRLRYGKCNELLGTSVAPPQVDEILARFGLTKSGTTNCGAEESATWSIPSYRHDLSREVDLIEEVVRVYGVQRINGSDRSRFTASTQADVEHDLETELRWSLTARGLNEARTSKLIPRHSAAFNQNALELRNPLSEEHVALRASLMGGLVEVLERNIRGGAERVAIFEIGRVFLPPNGDEKRHVGILLWGRRASEVHWRSDRKERFDFFDLKGAIEGLFPGPLEFRRGARHDLALAVEITLSGERVGVAGQLSQSLAARIDAPGGAFVAEFSGRAAARGGRRQRRFEEFGRFPAATRDIAMIIPENVTHQDVYREILSVPEPLLESVRLFDVFAGKEAEYLRPERKSLAYTLTYRAKSRTLTSDEVTVAHGRIRERLQSKLGAELRE